METKELVKSLAIVNKDTKDKNILLTTTGSMLYARYLSIESGDFKDYPLIACDKPVYFSINLAMFIKLLKTMEETIKIENKIETVTYNAWSYGYSNASDSDKKNNFLTIISGSSKTKLETVMGYPYDSYTAEMILGAVENVAVPVVETIVPEIAPEVETKPEIVPVADDKPIETALDLAGLKKLDKVVVEIVGTWIWISGETYKHRETIKAAGFYWSNSRKAWYKPDDNRSHKGHKYVSKYHSLDEVKLNYGSVAV